MKKTILVALSLSFLLAAPGVSAHHANRRHHHGTTRKVVSVAAPIAVGAAFGVILVRHGKSVVEVATFRSEGAYLDGRRPAEVRFTTAEEDAQRRDFTINGLFLDPLEGDRVIDYVGGQEDLAARKLRAIGDPSARFAEDHLRILASRTSIASGPCPTRRGAGACPAGRTKDGA